MSMIKPAAAERPLVLALDVGTSSVRAVFYDVRGRQLEEIEGRTHYQMTATPDGGVEIEADELVAMIGTTIDECLQQAAAQIGNLRGLIAAVGYSNFWHAMLGVDKHNRAVTPLYNWSDTRSANDARALAEQLGSDWIHQRTGVVPHASYFPAKIGWLRRTNPRLASQVARWISIGDYFYAQVFGRLVTSISIASGTGLFNPNRNDWDDELLAKLNLSHEDLASLADETSAAMSEILPEFTRRWPALSNAKWLPAVGDGAASNIGSGCATRDSIAINVGTSGAMRVCWPAPTVKIPLGLWCYRASRDYALIGGALSNAGDVYAWCRRTLQLGDNADTDGDGFADLEVQLAALPADGHGLTVLPFFSGERSTGWHDAARASMHGLNLSTRPIDLLRAALEAVCYRFEAIYERLRPELTGEPRIIASGGGILKSTVWTQMMADVIGVPVAASAVPEASSRGAALLALKSFGLLRDFAELPAPLGRTYGPVRENYERYQAGRARQEQLYQLLIG